MIKIIYKVNKVSRISTVIFSNCGFIMSLNDQILRRFVSELRQFLEDATPSLG